MHRFAAMTRGQKLAVGGICLILLTVAFYFYMGAGKTTEQKQQRSLPAVRVQTVERRDMQRHIVLSGQTVANASINLAPKYSGRIAAVYVSLGDRVEEGQVLMAQDMEDLDISIAQNTAAAGAAWADTREAAATYNANYLSKKNAYELAKSKYERQQYLFSIGAISQDTLDSVENEYTASKAAFEILANQVAGGEAAAVQSKEYNAVKQDRAVDALKKQREDMFLRAPRSGIIAYRNAEAGAMAASGTKAFTLVDNSHINVDCTISENDAAILTPGMAVSITIDALGRDYAGKIVFVSPAMEESSKSYLVRLEITEADEAVKAGLFAHTAVDILQRPQTIFVPQEAVLTRNGVNSVFVLLPDGTVEQREVKIGLLNDEDEEIISGLSEGEQVVLSNQDKLQTGTKVQVVS